MSDRQVPHLEDEELLTLLDGELSARDAAELRSHMEACWTCRTRMEEMKNTIGEYVRYRDAIRSLSPPPAPWGDLQPALEKIDRSVAPQVISAPIQRGRPVLLRPHYWLAAAAAVLVIIFVWRFQRVPSVSAAELLRKASAVEQRTAPRKRIHIKTRNRQFTRPASLPANAASENTDLQQMFERAHFNWDEPLSARSFAAWHDQLPEKKDDTPDLDNFVYKIHTSTSASELRHATIVLRAQDLQPLSETLEFTTETVEITGAPDEETTIAAAPAPERTPSREPVRPLEIVSPLHRELQVFSALHDIGADLGEPVEMSPDGSRLVVTGVGLTPARKQELRVALERIPGIEIRFDDAKPAPRAAAPTDDRATSATTPLHQRLQTLLGSRESVEDFTNRALDASDAMMARAHALRALATAFPAAAEVSLNAADRDLLKTMRTDHSAAFAARVRELRAVLQPILSATPAPVPEPSRQSGWQDAVQSLFNSAQTLDQLLNRTFAGSTADAQDTDLARITNALARVERATAQEL